MMKSDLSTLISQAPSKQMLEQATLSPEASLMALLGQGKLSEAEQEIIAVPEGEVNFADLFKSNIQKSETNLTQNDNFLNIMNTAKNKDELVFIKPEEIVDLKISKSIGENKVATIENLLDGKSLEFLKQAGERTTFPKKEANLKIVDIQQDLEAENLENILPMQFKAKNLPQAQISQFQKEQSLLSDNIISFNKEPKTKLDNKESVKKMDSFVENFNHRTELKLDSIIEAPNKSLDLSNIKLSDPQSKAELIDKITNYIQQNAVASEKSLDIQVSHEELGKFGLKVEKSNIKNSQEMNLNVTSGSSKAIEFFKLNEAEIIKSLDRSGIKITDFKVISSSDSIASTKTDTSSNFNFNKDQSSGQFADQKQQQGDQASQRRKELWDKARERSAA